MSDAAPQHAPKSAKTRFRRDLGHSHWSHSAGAGAEHGSSPAVARWLLGIVGAMYALYLLTMFVVFYRAEATLNKSSEAFSFLVQCLLPLVSLAVGFYFGGRSRRSASGPSVT